MEGRQYREISLVIFHLLNPDNHDFHRPRRKSRLPFQPFPLSRHFKTLLSPVSIRPLGSNHQVMRPARIFPKIGLSRNIPNALLSKFIVPGQSCVPAPSPFDRAIPLYSSVSALDSSRGRNDWYRVALFDNGGPPCKLELTKACKIVDSRRL